MNTIATTEYHTAEISQGMHDIAAGHAHYIPSSPWTRYELADFVRNAFG
jgi:hypothetical protein